MNVLGRNAIRFPSCLGAFVFIIARQNRAPVDPRRRACPDRPLKNTKAQGHEDAEAMFSRGFAISAFLNVNISPYGQILEDRSKAPFTLLRVFVPLCSGPRARTGRRWTRAGAHVLTDP
jgi:hypothetical protein